MWLSRAINDIWHPYHFGHLSSIRPPHQCQPRKGRVRAAVLIGHLCAANTENFDPRSLHVSSRLREYYMQFPIRLRPLGSSGVLQCVIRRPATPVRCLFGNSISQLRVRLSSPGWTPVNCETLLSLFSYKSQVCVMRAGTDLRDGGYIHTSESVIVAWPASHLG